MTWPGNHQWTQLVFELSDNFQRKKDGDIRGVLLLETLPVKICDNLMVSFLVTTFHCGEYDVYILAMKNWLKYIQVWFSSLACKCVTRIMMPMGAKYFFRDLLEHLLNMGKNKRGGAN